MPKLVLIDKLPVTLQMVSEEPITRRRMKTKKLHVWQGEELVTYEMPINVWQLVNPLVPPSGNILLGGYEIQLEPQENEGRREVQRYATHFLRPSDA